MVENGAIAIDGYIKVLQQLSIMGLVSLLSAVVFYFIKKIGIKSLQEPVREAKLPARTRLTFCA